MTPNLEKKTEIFDDIICFRLINRETLFKFYCASFSSRRYSFKYHRKYDIKL